ncbi:hypothetical protein P4U97_01000 [Bacillus swezeyi]|uniref:hypothetical protein n=1 Tax=Bacillus swezeyi TaxID=1925020 RepID=UPI0027DD7546|nr:hypothetical protein [Bacillus swezeyi]MED1738115.1 hypothetical protein [Bacillus swezeyi]
MNEERLGDFPRLKVISAILLTISTFGMYIPYWFLSRRQALEKCRIKLPYVAIKVTVLLFAFTILESFWVSFLSLGEDPLPYHHILLLPLHPERSFLPQFSFLLFCSVNIFSSFRIRKAFQRKRLKINGLWTFLFNISYLQHIMNKHISAAGLDETRKAV